jgi:hypothetical protein
MTTSPLGETSLAKVSGTIETVVAKGVGGTGETLVVTLELSWVPVADSPPNMAATIATRTMTTEAVTKPAVKRGWRMI